MHFFVEQSSANEQNGNTTKKTDNIVQQFAKKETMSKHQNQPKMHYVQGKAYMLVFWMQNLANLQLCMNEHWTM